MKELKLQLKDFSIAYPNADYEEIVVFFGTPEEIMKNYVEAEGIVTVSKRITTRKYLRMLVYGVFVFLFFTWVTFFGFWYKAYVEFAENSPVYIETTIDEGTIIRDP